MEGHGKVNTSVDEHSVIEMISFAINDMTDKYRNFPEFTCVDGTYKVSKHNFPLYLVLVQIRLGRGRSIFYAFVRRETSEMIQNVLQTFCDMMEGVSHTKTVMLEKD